MDATVRSYTIGTLAQAAAVNVETIRFYQRRGLMTAPERPARGIRRYDESEVTRLRFIKSAQHLGFSLDEVAELLLLDDGTNCAEARRLAVRKLEGIRERLAHLGRIETELARLVDDCATRRGPVKCPLISALREA